MFGPLNFIYKIYGYIFKNNDSKFSEVKGNIKEKNSASLISKLYNVLKFAKTFTNSTSLEEAIKKLKSSEKREREFLLKLEQKEIENICRDNISARERDQFIYKKSGSNFRANLILFFICFLLISCIISLIFFRKNLAADVVAIISGITGALSQCIRDVCHFEFGRSSAKKSDND